jgi:serine protease AprX
MCRSWVNLPKEEMKNQSIIVCFALVLAMAVPASAGPGAPEMPAATVLPVVRASGVTSAFVHVRAGGWRATIRAARAAGLSVGSRYRQIKVFTVVGRARAVRSLAGSRRVTYIEANRPLEFVSNTSHIATRGRDVLDRAITTAAGTRIDGRGVGIAIVDSGIDGTHPDLKARMAGNVRVVCTSPQPIAGGPLGGFSTCRAPKTFVAADDTDTPAAGGHGTHVAGIAAGDGSASKSRFHGAAPGARLFGVGVGTAVAVENGMDGLQWVLDNHSKVTPQIEVLNMSWGSSPRSYGANDPTFGALWKLQTELVSAGVTVVVAAGNEGGNGGQQRTLAECVNPTPGIICVAGYDDKNSGTRAGTIDPDSSRGARADSATWPDISAPGTLITSTCRVTLPVCSSHLSQQTSPEPNLYATLSGTSMAAPHVAGIVAQLIQVRPTLKPSEIEVLLKRTAHKFEFGDPYTSVPTLSGSERATSSPDKGHGLVDALAAVQRLLTPPASPPATPTVAPSPSTSP